MGFDAAGFNPNKPQPNAITNTNIPNVGKQDVVKNVPKETDAQINTESTVQFSFNASKTPSKALKDVSVNIFGQENIGKATLASVADRMDLDNGPLALIGKDLISQFRAI